MRLKGGNFWGSPPPVGNFASMCTSAVDLSMANWLNAGRNSISKTSNASLPAEVAPPNYPLHLTGEVVSCSLKSVGRVPRQVTEALCVIRFCEWRSYPNQLLVPIQTDNAVEIDVRLSRNFSVPFLF